MRFNSITSSSSIMCYVISGHRRLWVFTASYLVCLLAVFPQFNNATASYSHKFFTRCFPPFFLVSVCPVRLKFFKLSFFIKCPKKFTCIFFNMSLLFFLISLKHLCLYAPSIEFSISFCWITFLQPEVFPLSMGRLIHIHF